MDDSSDSTGSLLFDFADQLTADVEAGRVWPLAHYLARFPGHEAAIAREYEAHLASSAGAPPRARVAARPPERLGPYRILETLGRGGQGVVYRAEDVRLERIVALKVLSLSVASVSHGRRNRFRREAEIVSRLDHPGICTVLDADLDGDTPYIAMRFVEGETLHDALARVREAREASATPTPHDETTTSASRLLAPRRALELSETLSFFERAARALHAAHEAGVIHRDIKPGNIMVSKEGSPVILDFGLARGAEEESALLTRTGEVFGTPAYISPEQLSSGRDVDRRTDVYSLGVVLYECLTLVRPFQGDSSASLAQAIQSAPLPPVARHNPNLPPDVGVVLEAALERDVSRRYASAFEFAEELRRVRSYEPIRARPAGPILRLRRWAQRNPVIATGTIGSIVALSVALSVALVLLRRVNEEKERKEAALALYEGAWYRDQSASSLAYSPPRALHFAIAAAERDPGLASNRVLLAALDGLYQKEVLVGHRGLVMQVDVDAASERVVTSSVDGTARVWSAHTGAELATLPFPSGAVLCARFAPDGKRLVAAGSDGQLFVFDAAALPPSSASAGDAYRRASLALLGHTDDVHWAEFSPDGARIVSASRDRTVRVWDARDGRELVRYSGHTGSVSEARFVGAGGACVLTRSAEPLVGATAQESDSTARLFDSRTGEELRVFRGHTAAIVSMTVSPDGTRLATTSEDRTARVWRLDLDCTRRAARDDATANARTDEDPDAPARRSSGGDEGRARAPADIERASALGDMQRASASEGVEHARAPEDLEHASVLGDAEPERVFVAPGKFHCAAFSPDGARLALAWDAGAKVVDAATGELVYALPDHGHRAVVRVAFSPDGRELATIAYDDALRVFRADDGALLCTSRGDARQVNGLVWSPDSRFLVTWQRKPTVDVWYGTVRPYLQVLRGHTGEVRTSRFDASGSRVLTASADGTARIWKTATAALESVLDPGADGPRTPLVAARFDALGERVATTDEAGRVIVWNARDATPLGEHETGAVGALPASFGPDGRVLVAKASEPGCGLLIDVESGRRTRLVAHSAPISCFVFSPDGTRVATGAEDRTVCVWDASASSSAADSDARAPLWQSAPYDSSLYHIRSVFDVAFSADGRFVAAACENLRIVLFDARDGRVVYEYAGATPGRVAFSGDGSFLMATSKYSSFAMLARFRELSGGAELQRIVLPTGAGEQHTGSLTAIAAAARRARMVTGSLDKCVRAWDLDRRECVATYAGHTDRVLDVDVTADGKLIVSASSDGTARLWPGDLLETAKRSEPAGFAENFGPLPMPMEER